MTRCPDCGRRARGPHPPCRGLAPAPAPAAPAGSLPEVPGYRLGAPLGQGGFARVFAASRLADGAGVALKIARPEAGGAAEMLAHEAMVLRAVGPPAVPALLEAGRLADGTPFLAMERLAGPSLAERLADAGGALPAAALARVVPPLLEALGGLHAAGYAHGDLKPENVLVGGEPAGARLIDLALAWPLGTAPASAAPAASAGTPEYMSPEQCRGEPPDARSDLYALGALLLELAAGRPPFLGPAPEVRHAHLNLRPPRPEALAPMPAPLARAIEWCLAKAAADRPGSIAALARALEGELGAAPQAGPGAVAGPAGAERSAGERRTVGAIFLESGADAAALRAAAAGLGGVHAHADGRRHALVFDGAGGQNPVQRALEAARAALAGGLTPRALVDLVPALVRTRPGGADRYLSAAFSEPGSWPLPADPPGVLATARAAEVLPGAALAPVPGRPGLLAAGDRGGGAEPTVVRGGSPALLGRDEVLERLAAAARAAAGERAPAVVAVLGDPGLGKSHLAAALGDRLRALSPAPLVVELRARAAADGDALAALLRWLLDVPADAPAPPGAGRALLELALGPEDLAEAWPAVALAMGWLEPDAPALAPSAAAPGALAGLAARAAAALLRRRAVVRPLYVLLDDAHLASGAALDALEQAALAEAEAPLLVCALARPALLERRPAWGERAARRVVERLEPLAAEAAEALCRRLLAPAEGIPAAALTRLAARASGVPLLLVELVRGLRAEGLVRPKPGGRAHYLATDELDRAVDLPAVEWLAAAALRSMPPDLAAHAQLSALLGDEVPAAEAAAVLTLLVEAGLGAAFPLDAAAAVRRLVERGLLARHRDGATSFRLPVVRDAVARSAPEARRRAIHEAAYRLHAQPGLLPEPARLARLAVHARETGRLAEAGAAFLGLAADRAARHAYLEAETLYSRSLESLPAGAAAGRLAALRGRGLMRSRVARHRDAVSDLAAAVEAARGLGDADAERHALLDEAGALDWMNDFSAARACVDGAAAVAGPVGPHLGARLALGRGRALFRASRAAEAISPLEAAAAAAHAVGDEGYETRVAALLLLGTVLPYVGRPGEAQAALERARAEAIARGDLVHVAVALSNARNPALVLGETELAIRGLHQSIRIARELGHLDSEYYAQYNLAELHYHLEEPVRSAPHLERAEEIERVHPEAAPGPLGRLLRARALLHAGDLDAALAALARYREARAAGWGGRELPPAEAVLAGMVELAAGGASDEAWQALLDRSAHDSAEQEPVEVLEARGLAAQRSGRPEVAREALAAALALTARLPGPLTGRIRRALAAVIPSPIA